MEKVRWSARVIALQALTGYTEEVWKDVAIDGIDLAGDGRIDDWGARLFALAVLRCDLPEDEVEQVATLETIINVARREDDGNCRAEVAKLIVALDGRDALEAARDTISGDDAERRVERENLTAILTIVDELALAEGATSASTGVAGGEGG